MDILWIYEVDCSATQPQVLAMGTFIEALAHITSCRSKLDAYIIKQYFLFFIFVFFLMRAKKDVAITIKNLFLRQIRLCKLKLQLVNDEVKNQRFEQL